MAGGVGWAAPPREDMMRRKKEKLPEEPTLRTTHGYQQYRYGKYGHKRDVIQDTGHCGHAAPVTKHPKDNGGPGA